MPKVKRYLSPEYIRAILHYDPNTGVMRWKVDKGSRCKAGDIAGRMGVQGYWQITIDGRLFTRAPLAVAYMMNFWPDRIIDHINKDKADDRFINLRPATDKQSNRNRTSKNQHGLKGITTKRNLFRARIMVDGKSIHIGYYRTKEEAHAAYLEKARELHGKFASD